jgi:DNA/RNA-binding domain of Phe-tRNA-synthetase-like protein
VFFGHAPALWEQFPQLVPGVLVVRGIHPGLEVRALLEPWHARARERLARGPESELAEVSAWRRAYAQMGFKPTQYRSAGEALLRRFRREGDLPRLHPLVDLCNAVSLAHALPVAVLGEVIFADAANHAHARRWTFRQSRRSTVTADTREVLIVTEGLHPTARADVPALIDALAGSHAGLWGAPPHRAVRRAAAPRRELAV